MQEKNPQEDLSKIALALAKNQSALYGTIYVMLGDHSVAEDVLQETNIVIYKNAARLDSIDHFLPWAKTIAVFQAKRYRTEHARECRKLVFDDETVSRLAETLTAEDSAEADAARDIAFDALESCVKKLPSPKRALIYRHYWKQDPLASLAKEQDSSLSSVKMQFLRIRRELGDCIRKLICAFGGEPPTTPEDRERAELFESVFSRDGKRRPELNRRLTQDADFLREWLECGRVHAALAYNIEKLRIDGTFADVEEEQPAIRRWPRVIGLAAALTLLFGGILWAVVRNPEPETVATEAPAAASAAATAVPASSGTAAVTSQTQIPIVAASATTPATSSSGVAVSAAGTTKEKGKTMTVKSAVAVAAVAVAAVSPHKALSTEKPDVRFVEGFSIRDGLETRSHAEGRSEGRTTWTLSTIPPAGTIYRFF